jgi:hypothetical protein
MSDSGSAKDRHTGPWKAAFITGVGLKHVFHFEGVQCLANGSDVGCRREIDRKFLVHAKQGSSRINTASIAKDGEALRELFNCHQILLHQLITDASIYCAACNLW